MLAASGLLYTRYLHYDHNLKKTTGVIKPGGATAADGAENVLLVGSDSRAGTGDQFAQAPKGQTPVEGQRSDTVMLAHLAKGNKAATLVSLPRDSWVTIPAYTDAKGVAHPAHLDKLNAAFSLGGAPLLVSTVQQLTGIHIDHYVEIDFAGFQNMVNALGGVDICLSQPAHDVQTGLNLTAGHAPPERHDRAGVRPAALRPAPRRHRPHQAAATVHGVDDAQGRECGHAGESAEAERLP